MNMLLNELPDDCLLTIIDNLIYIEDLLCLSKVCSRLKSLVLYRLSKVKYLFSKQTNNFSSSYIVFGKPITLLDPNLSQLLPNLKVLDLGSLVDKLDSVEIDLFNSSIGGIIHQLICSACTGYCYQELDPRCNILTSQTILNSSGRTQIYFYQCFLSRLTRLTLRYKENLFRLHINDVEYLNRGGLVDEIFYEEPGLENLKILELASSSYDGTILFPGFHVMDWCPSLESAYFFTETICFYVDEDIKNLNMRDLVIEYIDKEYAQEWPSLRLLLSKFPNLKNLAIRGNDEFTDDHVEDLLYLLPKLKVLDCRHSQNITHESTKHVSRYCRQNKKSIEFYYDCDPADQKEWPQINGDVSNICHGFDFMEHCFFRTWHQLPLFLFD